MIGAAVLASVVFSSALVGAGEPTRELRAFFRQQMGLSDDQIATIARGTAVAKMLPSKTPAEIFVFGAVFVNAAPEEYLKLAFDMDRLRKFPGYLGIGRVSTPPALSDLEALLAGYREAARKTGESGHIQPPQLQASGNRK